MVFDATIEGWENYYEVVFPRLDTPPVILTPLPGRRWRVYLRPTADTSDLVAEAGEVLRRYQPGARFAGFENPTRFRCHSRVAARFRSGRVLLAGDAAHACTPAEGHGMNTGLQDAFNLGWKLALVCRGDAGAGLLDSYEGERRQVAERIVASGADVEIAQAMTDAGERAARDHTVIVHGGPQADSGRVGDLVGELEARCSAAVDAVVGLCTRPGGPRVGRIDAVVAA